MTQNMFLTSLDNSELLNTNGQFQLPVFLFIWRVTVRQIDVLRYNEAVMWVKKDILIIIWQIVHFVCVCVTVKYINLILSTRKYCFLDNFT